MTAAIACRWSVLVVGVSALVVLALDAAYVIITSRLARFRRKVDDGLARRERRAAAIARAALLQRMSGEHQQELFALESLVDTMRACPQSRAAPIRAVLDACGVLLASYVRLAIQYRSGELCLACVSRKQLDEDLFVLEHTPCPDSVRPHMQRRITLSRERAQLWDESRERLGLLREQLRMISDRIRLAAEEVSAVPADLFEEGHLRVAALDEEEMQLVRLEEDVDAQTLALGRGAVDAPASST